MKTLFTLLSMAMALPAPAWAAEDFTGTKEVRLIHGDLGSPKAKTVVITDKAKIEKLVATIKLEKKVPCACDHIQHAVFVMGAGEITVSLCDHCFDIGKAASTCPTRSVSSTARSRNSNSGFASSRAPTPYSTAATCLHIEA